jgi:hypothetical protein
MSRVLTAPQKTEIHRRDAEAAEKREIAAVETERSSEINFSESDDTAAAPH